MQPVRSKIKKNCLSTCTLKRSNKYVYSYYQLSKQPCNRITGSKPKAISEEMGFIAKSLQSHFVISCNHYSRRIVYYNSAIDEWLQQQERLVFVVVVVVVIFSSSTTFIAVHITVRVLMKGGRFLLLHFLSTSTFFKHQTAHERCDSTSCSRDKYTTEQSVSGMER